MVHQESTPADGQPKELQAQHVAEQIATQVRGFPSAEAVCVQGTDWGFECWILANHSTREERYRWYDEEMILLQQMPHLLAFHFLDREGRPPDEMITLNSNNGWVSLLDQQEYA